MGDGSPVDENVSINLAGSPGRVTAEWKTVTNEEGVEQLLRFKYTVSSEGANDWILFRLLPAAWFDAVAAS